MKGGAVDDIVKLKAELLVALRENERLEKRLKEHEQFRHQHRDCSKMGIALHQIGMLVKRAQEPSPQVPNP